MFKWFKLLKAATPIEFLRGITMPAKQSFPEWFLYSLPDALWNFSFMSIILLIWRNQVNKENCFWVFIMPLISIFSEVGQLLNIIPGTFDLMDLIFYVSGATLPVLIFTNHLITQKINKT
jgi:hypothetical protein